jgi:hypothetical protein
MRMHKSQLVIFLLFVACEVGAQNTEQSRSREGAFIGWSSSSMPPAAMNLHVEAKSSPAARRTIMR